MAPLERPQPDYIRIDDPEVGGKPTPLGSNPVDSLAFFTRAISYAQSLYNVGAKIVVPRGQWFTSGDIVLPDGFGLVGETPNAARIRAMSGYSGTAMIRNATNSQEYVWCEDLFVDGRNFAPIGILYDTVFANSGITRCVVLNHTTNAIKVATTVIPGGSGPVFLDNTWALLAGQNVLELTGSVQVWARNLTAEHPGAGYACVNLAGAGAAHGCSFEHVHLEANQAGCKGIVVDGATSTYIKNVTGGGSQPFADVVRISNLSGATVGVTVDGVYCSSTAPNGINDTVNSFVTTGKNFYPRYVTAV